MKISEAKALQLQEKLNEMGFKPTDFSLVKKRGWVVVSIEGEAEQWSYFEEKSTTIDLETHQWVNKSEFYTKTTTSEKQTFSQWNEVISDLGAWLTKKKNSPR